MIQSCYVAFHFSYFIIVHITRTLEKVLLSNTTIKWMSHSRKLYSLVDNWYLLYVMLGWISSLVIWYLAVFCGVICGICVKKIFVSVEFVLDSHRALLHIWYSSHASICLFYIIVKIFSFINRGLVSDVINFLWVTWIQILLLGARSNTNHLNLFCLRIPLNLGFCLNWGGKV